jgi:hypothetical protein
LCLAIYVAWHVATQASFTGAGKEGTMIFDHSRLEDA